MTPRFFCPMPLHSGTRVSLPTEQAHHARQVLRLDDGEAVVLFNGEGGAFAATLNIAGREVSASVGAHTPGDLLPALSIHLVQGLATGDKMDWVVQKGSEIGVASVTPIAAERSVLKLAGERASKRVAHWQQVAVASAEQCGRNKVLQIADICSLSGWLASAAAGECWILDPDEGEPLSSLAAPAGPVSILIGPEGGWSPAELAAARAARCRRVRMGPRVLRTETAGLAVAAAMLGRWGDY